MRSFLTQYYQVLYAAMACQYSNTSPGITVNDTGGTGRAIGTTNFNVNQNMATQNVAANAGYGIQVGTGTTANGATTDALATLIATGNGAGQLAYGAMGITTPSGTSPLSFTFTRTFTNNSGAGITINELGLVVAQNLSGTGQVNFMIVRDVLGTGVTVNNGANITWTLTLSYTIA